MNKNFTKNEKSGFIYFTDNRLSKLGIKHAFTSKCGGVSKGNFSSLNLSFSRNDNINDVLENYKIVSKTLNLNYNRITITAQTHTKNISIIDESNVGTGFIHDSFKDVDGLITNLQDTPLFAFFADCVPIILYDQTNNVISAIHSGWKGTAQQILRYAVEIFVKKFNSNPCDIIASIGPSISMKNFEIDVCTAKKLNDIPNAENSIFKINNKFNADLWQLNKNILIDCGVLLKNIESIELCTVDNSDLFYSHRVSGEKRGNFAAIISL